MTRRTALLLALAPVAALALPALAAFGARRAAAGGPAAAAAPAGTAHDFRFPALEGGEIDLAAFRGRPILVVNTASLCGFTGQYEGLQALADRYGDRLAVIGVPSDDFNQELASAAAVKEFCTLNYAITFPLTAILPVRGERAHPFFRWAAAAGGAAAVPRWNFHKILVGPDGRFAAAFGTMVDPASPRLAAAIDRLLAPGGS